MRHRSPLLLGLLGPGLVSASTPDFTNLDLEALMQVEVTSVSRRSEALFDAPAGIYVLTHDDIQRSGHLLLADILTTVPGVQSSRIDASNTAISVRGFNDRFADKILVLEDGRSVYDRLFAGVFWNFSGAFLPDLERIEIIRGPGATLWGANAVNGVINIHSRSAFETQGTYVRTAIGSELDHSVEVRHGLRLGDKAALRIYGRDYASGDFGTDIGEGTEGWRLSSLGTRLDVQPDPNRTFTLIGDLRLLRDHSRSPLPTWQAPYYAFPEDTVERLGGTLHGRWQQPLFGDGKLSVHASYEHIDATELNYDERRDIVDLDAQVDWSPHAAHHIVAGASLRNEAERERSTPWTSYTPTHHTQHITGAFAQDEWTLLPGRVALTGGAKLEHSDYDGWQFQPSARALWHPTPNTTLWAAISVASRLPSRVDRAGEIWASTQPPSLATGGLPVAIHMVGSSAFRSERLLAYELGARWRINEQLEFDSSFFMNRYSRLRTLAFRDLIFVTTPVPHLRYTTIASNAASEAHTAGSEWLLRWQAPRHWLVETSVSTLDVHLDKPEDFDTYDRRVIAESAPRWQAQLTVHGPLTTTISAYLSVHHREQLPGVPAYTGIDLRLTWRLPYAWEASLAGRDLLDHSHAETAGNEFTLGSIELRRSATMSLSRSF